MEWLALLLELGRWLGLTTGWMLLSVLLIVPMLVLVRGEPAVTLARRYELAAATVIVAPLVLKPS